MIGHQHPPWRFLGSLALALPVLAGACMWGDVLYDTSQRALILEPIDQVRFTLDHGNVEVFAFNRTAINLFYYLTGAENEIGEVGYKIADTELQAFIECADPDGFCNANFSVEVPYGTRILATTHNGGVKLTGVDAEIVAVVAGGDFEGVELSSPSLDVAALTGNITIVQLSAPMTLQLAALTGNVDLTLPAGSYHCERAASDGDIVTTGIICDDTATSRIKIDVTTGDIHVQAAP